MFDRLVERREKGGLPSDRGESGGVAAVAVEKDWFPSRLQDHTMGRGHL